MAASIDLPDMLDIKVDGRVATVYDKYARPSALHGPLESGNPVVRPRTSKGQRKSIDLSDESMDYSIDTTVNRPKTGRGRRPSADQGYENQVIMIPDGTTPVIDGSRLRKNSETRNSTEGYVRPRTARGRRQSEAGPPGPSTSPVETDLARPKTSKGRRSTIAGSIGAVTGNMTSPRQTNNGVNVLTVDPAVRPRIARQRRSSMGVTSGPETDTSERLTARKTTRHGSIDVVGDYDRNMVPSPPDDPSPRRQRPKSRYKNRAERSYSQDSGALYPRSDSVTSEASRPQTALNRFTPLPSIGAKGQPSPPPMNNAEMAAAVQRLQINNPMAGQTEIRPRSHYEIERECNVSYSLVNNPNNVDVVENQPPVEDSSPSDDGNPFKALRREVTLIPEPGDSHKIVLGIKLPSGQRIQRAFHPDDPLVGVIEFAEVSAQLDFSGCELVCWASGPRQVFSDLTLTLAQSGIQGRTLLHIERPDEP